MARFVTDFIVERPDADQFIQFISQDFFQKEGFRYVNFKGENVWKKGTGALAAPQFIKLEFSGGRVHLEAWLRAVWLPGVYGKEMDFTGAWGFAVKEVFRGTVNQLIGLLTQPQMVSGGAQQTPPQQFAGGELPQQFSAPPAEGMQQAPQQPVPVIVHNTKGSAILSLVMGLVSFFGIWIPIIGFVCGIIGILSGVKGRRSSAVGMATAGLVLSIIFLVLSIISWALAILLYSLLW